MKPLQDKLRGVKKGPVPELTRLKALWRKWPDEERQKVLSWREESDPKPITNADIRARMKKYYGISLVRDGQLSEFWRWVSSELERESLNEFMEAREQSLIESQPNRSREDIRDQMIKEWYAMAHARGDAKLGLKVVKADLQDRGQTFEESKFKESLRSKLQAGLDELASSLKGNPDAMKLYQQMRQMISRETK